MSSTAPDCGATTTGKWVSSTTPGIRFAVQRGRSEPLAPSAERHDLVQFEFSLRLGAPLSEKSFNFVGEYAQGPPSDRFI